MSMAVTPKGEIRAAVRACLMLAPSAAISRPSHLSSGAQTALASSLDLTRARFERTA